MGIRGTLTTMSVADVLQFLAAGRKTGVLKIGRGTIIKQIYLENGLIVGSASNDPKEFLGQVLLHYGKIDEAQLQMGMDIHRQTGARVGDVLAARGFVTNADIMDVLRTRTLEIIYDLFIWEQADFEFFDSEPLPQDLTRIQVDATSVIMDGIYRIDEWARYRRVIPSDRTFFELKSGWTQSVRDSKEVREILFHVEKRHTAAEICFNLHTSLFHTYAVLFDLVEKGAIKVAGEAAPPAAELATDLPALKLPQTVPELIALARADLKKNEVENALTFIHSALEQEPKNTEAHRLREELERAYVAKIYQNGLSPRAVPRLVANLDQLANERLDPQEGFVISRINGQLDIAGILSVCPFREADSLRMIRMLLDRGIIAV